MGCCPFFRKHYKIQDMASSNIEVSESDPSRAIKSIHVVPPPEPKSEPHRGETHNPTDSELNELRPGGLAAEEQSNLEIALSVSQENEDVCSGGTAEHLICPNMIIIRHSKVRESVVFQWQKPEFEVEQLFLPIDYDKLFQS